MARALRWLGISALHASAWGCVVWITYAVWLDSKYSNAFESVTIGESLGEVTRALGSPSAIEGHVSGDDSWHCIDACQMRLWYESPLSIASRYSVDFGSDGRVLSKYNWVSP